MNSNPSIGFIGLGVMGGPMCRNVAVKHVGPVTAFDLSADALAELSDTKAVAAASVAEVAGRSDVIFLSLPGDKQVEAVCTGPSGILSVARPGTNVVDLSTTSVDAAQRIARQFQSRLSRK